MPHRWEKPAGFWMCSRCKLVLATKKRPRRTRKYPVLLLKGPYIRDEQGHVRFTCEELQVYRVMES